MPWLALFSLKKGLLLALALAVAGVFAFQRVQLTEARRAQDSTATALAEARSELFAARQTLEAVNAESTARLAKARQAAKRAEQVAASAEARARAIESAPAPATCEAAIELLVEGVKP